MSALDIYDNQRDEQIEEGNFSEEFTYTLDSVVTTFKGIYDESYITEERDQGNFRQQKRKPVILISTIPAGIVAKTTKVLVGGVERLINKIDRDTRGVPRLWLI